VLGPRSAGELRRGIATLRRTHNLPPAEADAALDEVAQSTAQELARGTLTRERAGEPMEKALAKLAGRYKAVRSVMAVTGGLSQVVTSLEKSLLDPQIDALGIGLAAAASGSLHVVLVLATRRDKLQDSVRSVSP
jgi:hypothetical protein